METRLRGPKTQDVGPRADHPGDDPVGRRVAAIAQGDQRLTRHGVPDPGRLVHGRGEEHVLWRGVLARLCPVTGGGRGGRCGQPDQRDNGARVADQRDPLAVRVWAQCPDADHEKRFAGEIDGSRQQGAIGRKGTPGALDVRHPVRVDGRSGLGIFVQRAKRRDLRDQLGRVGEHRLRVGRRVESRLERPSIVQAPRAETDELLGGGHKEVHVGQPEALARVGQRRH